VNDTLPDLSDMPHELTPRQGEILRLLRAGRVNKEIARELGIGLGTVKQHMVAIFKRLHVSNRAMAASHEPGTARSTLIDAGGNAYVGANANAETSANIGGESNEGKKPKAVEGNGLSEEGLLERRPCVVLSFSLTEDCALASVKRLHVLLAEQAFEQQAVFLAKQRYSGDVICGMHQVTEYDLLRAFQTAFSVYEDLRNFDPIAAKNLRGGLTVGLAVASMKRFGGWSGEAIASTSISIARQLLAQAAPETLIADQAARDLMRAFGLGQGQDGIEKEVIRLSDLGALYWSGDRIAFPLVGRQIELALCEKALLAAVSGVGSLLYLLGETGMGKSRVCREVLAIGSRLGVSQFFFRGQPFGEGKMLRNCVTGSVVSFDEVADLVSTLNAPCLIILDDLHLLGQDQQMQLHDVALRAAERGNLLMFSGRSLIGARHETQMSAPTSFPARVETILLQRLPVKEITALVKGVLNKRGKLLKPSVVKEVVMKASGVPLFAVELARYRDSGMLALPLLVVVCARLDKLQLDRKLLAALAGATSGIDRNAIGRLFFGNPVDIDRSIEQALGAGVLVENPDQSFSFSHPILRQVIEYLRME
jgi:DNA-binding CsgD family transcriptional regulator